MNKVTLTIEANSDGRYLTKDVLKQIKAACKVIVFPDKPIEETCLADLSLNGELCYQGITEGIWNSWNNKIVEYMKLKVTLFFG